MRSCCRGRSRTRRTPPSRSRPGTTSTCAPRCAAADSCLSERRIGNESAIRRRYEHLVEENQPAYLFSGFLLKSAKSTKDDTALAFALGIAIEVPLLEVDQEFWFNEHFEGETLLNDTVTLHLRLRGGKATVRYGLRTKLGSCHATRRGALSDPGEHDRMHLEIPLGFEKGMENPPRPGFRGRLVR